MSDKYIPSPYLDSITVGARTYKVNLFEDSPAGKFNKKIYRYPDGKYQVVYANSRVFTVPKQPRLISDSFTDKELFRSRSRSSSSDKDLSAEEKEYKAQRLDNLYRARTRMKQIVMCNSWDYFVTLTFDDEKVNASDSSLVRNKAQKWLNNMVARQGIAYLLIPEYHKKNNRIHFHALIKGQLDLTFDNIYTVDGYDKPLKASTIKRKNIPVERIKSKVYNVRGWKYGFSTAIDIYGSTDCLSNYLFKYMTKDVHRIFSHYYWVSRNLQLYPVVELSNTNDYWKVPSKEYTHGACDIRFKYVDRTGEAITDDE